MATGSGRSVIPVTVLAPLTMNYLAHAFLAKPTLHSLTGNLLGDFCKGVDTTLLHPQIYAGLMNHRAVDLFTDHHPEVKAAKALFSPQRRRFAGVALDVLFDHYLIVHWHRYSKTAFSGYKTQLYQQLRQALPLMPLSMASTINNLVKHDWLQQYQQLDKVAVALDRIASRIRFKHQFYGIGEELAKHHQDLEQLFLHFFPQLQQHVAELTIESTDSD